MRTLYLVFLLFLNKIEARVPDQVFYWPIKPFIFYNNNTLDGILPFLYNRLAELCSPNQKLAEFHLVNKTFIQSVFYKTVREVSSGFKSAKNITINNAIWYPLLITPDRNFLSTYKVKADFFIHSPSVGVITNKEKITITNKVIESIKKSTSIALHAGGFILIFSALLWLTECKKNNDFSNTFVKGFGTGIWWSIVTVATVGYGDIVPKSLIGRILSILWMIIGITLVSGLTGMFSSVMTTNSFLSIQDQKIAAFNNSVEFFVANKNYNSSLKRVYYSYEDVLDDVNSNNVDYGVINIDVLLNINYKLLYENIALVKLLDSASPVLIAFGNETNLMANFYPFNEFPPDEVLNCLKRLNMKDIIQNVQEIYHKIPNIDIEAGQNFNDFMKIHYIKYTLIIILMVAICFSIKDVIPYIYYIYNGHKHNKINDINTNVPMNLLFNKDVKEESKSINNLLEELSTINEQLIKLHGVILSIQYCSVCSKQPQKTLDS
ncbi:uncharacterized protein LOC105846050 isoform X1 [Hydra vulgaris]|uniref:uncharacterized protein LOC105846050 isoform X1 n=1 Tax=Hydra vulgaris TaxID=6087 RepID=UPI001F5E8270|nr:uncharacterized protein LOC105846050 isoform X1 [Hydra vulgaris]